MAEGFHFERLKSEILPLSSAQVWATARKEWRLINIVQAEPEQPETCLCGHHPILELCEIRNETTGKTATVGNQCVMRFLGLETEALFRGIRRIRKDDSKSMGPDLAVWLFERSALTKWEYDFQSDTTRKRVLTQKQLSLRQKINAKALQSIRRRGFDP